MARVRGREGGHEYRRGCLDGRTDRCAWRRAASGCDGHRIDLNGESGFAVAQKLVGGGGVDAGRVMLLSAYAKKEFADLIEASPAVGFLSEPDLSAERSAGCWSGDSHRIQLVHDVVRQHLDAHNAP